MKSLITNKQHRARAREALKNQWGTLALITFLSIIIRIIVGSIVGGIFGGNMEESVDAGETLSSFLLNNLLFFAITYGTYFAALQVIRGKKVSVNALMVVFQGKYYGPMLIINFIQYIIERLVGLIVLLPVLIIYGTTYYFGLMFNSMTPAQLQTDFSGDIALALTILAFLLLVLFLGMFISGIFQFAVWLRFDQPELTATGALKSALNLMKGRFWQYVGLQLSFVGWYILGTILLFVGLLWVVPYQNVAVASFYNTAREEKGLAVIA